MSVVSFGSGALDFTDGFVEAFHFLVRSDGYSQVVFYSVTCEIADIDVALFKLLKKLLRRYLRRPGKDEVGL